MYPNDSPSFLDCKWGNDSTVTRKAGDAFLSLSSWPGAGDSVMSFPVLVGRATGDRALAFLGLGLGFLSALGLQGIALPGPYSLSSSGETTRQSPWDSVSGERTSARLCGPQGAVGPETRELCGLGPAPGYPEPGLSALAAAGGLLLEPLELWPRAVWRSH